MRKPKGQTDEVNCLNSPWQMGMVVQACSAGLSAKIDKNATFWRHAVCNLVGWRAEPSMAIPAVHIAPLGANARGMDQVVVWWSIRMGPGVTS